VILALEARPNATLSTTVSSWARFRSQGRRWLPRDARGGTGIRAADEPAFAGGRPVDAAAAATDPGGRLYRALRRRPRPRSVRLWLVDFDETDRCRSGKRIGFAPIESPSSAPRLSRAQSGSTPNPAGST